MMYSSYFSTADMMRYQTIHCICIMKHYRNYIPSYEKKGTELKISMYNYSKSSLNVPVKVVSSLH